MGQVPGWELFFGQTLARTCGKLPQTLAQIHTRPLTTDTEGRHILGGENIHVLDFHG